MKEIKLTHGNVALVDDEDYEFLNQWKWCAHGKGRNFYAIRTKKISGGGSIHIPMHRVIMNTPKGMEVDHIDHNGFNNQRYNLRNCTPTENKRNRLSFGNINYLGVSYYNPKRKKLKPFRATIYHNGKNIHLGTFKTAEDAAIAYNKAALKYKGEFANFNVISSENTDYNWLVSLYKEKFH